MNRVDKQPVSFSWKKKQELCWLCFEISFKAEYDLPFYQPFSERVLILAKINDFCFCGQDSILPFEKPPCGFIKEKTF